jgi:hypothetical protein
MNISLYHFISNSEDQCNVTITGMSAKAERNEDAEKFLGK